MPDNESLEAMTTRLHGIAAIIESLGERMSKGEIYLTDLNTCHKHLESETVQDSSGAEELVLRGVALDVRIEYALVKPLRFKGG